MYSYNYLSFKDKVLVTIPYAFSNKLHELIHISEAFSGMHGYYCPSCEIEMG